MTNTFIRVKFQQEGFHRWKDAERLGQAYAYLAQTHRHLFEVAVTVQVFGSDRELEFHKLLKVCEEHFLDIVAYRPDMTDNRLSKSCEQMAKELVEILISKYGTARAISAEVSEDGECSGIYAYEPASI